MERGVPHCGVGQTSDRHSKEEENPSSVLREHREVIRKKLRLLVEGKLNEARTSKIEFRTWPDLKYIYGKAPSTIKTAARKAFEAVILSWFLGIEKVETAVSHGAPVILNINIAEAKAEAKISVKIVNELEELKSFLEWLAYQSDPHRYPEAVRRRAARGLRVINDVLRNITN